MSDIVYLAAPYSDPDPQVSEARVWAVTRSAAKMIAAGLVVYSPLTMTHPIHVMLVEMGIDRDSDAWTDYDESFMEHCESLAVLMLPGWDRSNGVAREIEFFERRGRRIWYIDHE